MIARLKLKNIVDVYDANETMEFYNFILQQFEQVVNVTTDPRDIAYDECVKVIAESEFALPFVEIVKLACQRNEHVGLYIGDKYDLTHNFKLRPIADLLANSKSIKQVSLKPLVFARIRQNEQTRSSNSRLYDVYDAYDEYEAGKEKEKVAKKPYKPNKKTGNQINPKQDQTSWSGSL